MKAIVRTSLEPGCMEIQERPIPEIAEDEVLIKVKAVGVCGTDLHIYNGNVVTGTDVVIGHELSGVIDKVGAKVTKVKPVKHAFPVIRRCVSTEPVRVIG